MQAAPRATRERVDVMQVPEDYSLMRFLWHKLQEIRRASESLRMAQQFHVESRAQMAAAAQAGRSGEALRESARLMGVGRGRPARGRIVSIGGVRM